AAVPDACRRAAVVSRRRRRSGHHRRRGDGWRARAGVAVRGAAPPRDRREGAGAALNRRRDARTAPGGVGLSLSSRCVRHPEAARHGGHCAACLLEDALMHASPVAAGETLTIQLPLGASATASVFLVTQDGPPIRLLRLKTWRRRAPGDFMARFERLRREMTGWPHEAIPAAETARGGPAGRPSMPSEI